MNFKLLFVCANRGVLLQLQQSYEESAVVATTLEQTLWRNLSGGVVTIDHPESNLNPGENSQGMNKEESAAQDKNVTDLVLPSWLVDSLKQEDLSSKDDGSNTFYKSLLEVFKEEEKMNFMFIL